MDKHKLGIIVPYRNRPEQLEKFKNETMNYLSDKDIDYEIFIIEQDNEKQFNRGVLLNIGYRYAKESNCDYLCFHDVDMLPYDVDYSYSSFPVHLATDFILDTNEKDREFFEEYFGGVTLFPIEQFEKINGYSNKYWGWGYEDTDLLFRCKFNDIPLKMLEIENIGKKGKTLLFNGVNSYVEGKNIFNLNYDCTFFVSFNPGPFTFDHTKEMDTYTIFSIPGWDFALSCNSFFRYSFCAFDNKLIPLYVNTNIRPNYKTNMVVVVNSNEKHISIYQDGKLIGKTESYKKLYFYRKEPNFYLGVGSLKREDSPNFFKGSIDTFAYFDEMLSDEVIKEISKNKKHYLNESFGKYKHTESLKLYYDADFIDDYKLNDLSGNNNHGNIFNSDIVKQHFYDHTDIQIPFRRHSTFKSLIHEENGFFNNKWKDQATRWNQLRFHNEVVINPELTKNDGISDLTFTTHSINKNNKVSKIFVGL